MSDWEAMVCCDASTGQATAIDPGGRQVARWTEPLAALRWMDDEINRRAPSAGDRRWVGYLGYDLGRWFERLPSRAADDLHLPLFTFVLGTGDAAHREDPPSPSLVPVSDPRVPATSNFTKPAYLAAVQRAIDYIAAGDIFQVNLSQRFSAPCSLSPASLLDRLRQGGGAWYGALLDFGSFAVVSNSPELFLRVAPLPDGTRRVVTRPIKGTRPRSPGMAEELLRSEKDQAELNMIIDLERNDLGRVCRVGSVRVTEPRTIEPHPTVHHGVATVEGVLRDGVSLVDLLRATFPGGSITGAPKIRAMEIIDELEPTRRGPYCGAIGWIGPNGRLELNVAIRTATLADSVAHVPVGGGIVADSTPDLEYAETLVKARALFTALGVQASQG